jgi:endonuclease G
MKKIISLIILLTTVVAFSCKEKEKPIVPTLSFSVASPIRLSAEAQGTSFRVQSNQQWTITPSSAEVNWYTIVDPADLKGDRNAEVSITVTTNEVDAERLLKLIFATSDGKLSDTVQIIQAAGTPIERHPRLELPAIKDQNWYLEYLNPDQSINYTIEYDTAQKHSIWVAYKLLRSHMASGNRTDAWAQDTRIPARYRAIEADFSGYQRGHLCPSADRNASTAINRPTFYYSNMSPQIGAFNAEIWANLETKVRNWAKGSDCDTLYVVTGGAINPGIETLGTNGAIKMTIPKYYYKALLKRKDNAFEGIAFWMEHKPYSSNTVTHTYSMTIDDLEELTKIDFFPNLSDAVEEAVESTRNTAKWPL